VSVTVRQLAELVRGTLVGDGDIVIRAARPLADAQPGDISFIDAIDRLPAELARCQASAVVVPLAALANGSTMIRVEDPFAAFIEIARHLHARPELPRHGVDQRASVDPTVKLGPDVSIHPFAVVSADSAIGARCRIHSGCSIGRHCILGDDVTLYPNVVVYDGTVVGNRVTIHAGTVVGADGFGYRLKHGRHEKVPQLGWVEIGDDVEIGAGTTIDRGTFGPTRIGEGTKIDNLVQIGHNCRIGRHNLLVSQVGIAGSCTTGDHVVMAGQVGIADHVQIGERAIIGAKSGVPQDIPAGETVLGAPARPARQQKRILLTLDKLPDMRRDLERIKQHLGMKDPG
jgi:UDP-3-O-[3-hydroxymyristoyl] glucosamine N-acyltransferase